MVMRALLVSLLVSASVWAQEPVWTPLGSDVSYFLVDGARRLASAPGERGVVVSEDGGATWTAMAAGLPGNAQAIPVYLDADAAFATTFGGQFFRSDDGGRTWDDASVGLVSPRLDGGGPARFVQALVRVGSQYLAVTPFAVFLGGARAGSDAAPWAPASGLPGYTDTGLDFVAFDAAAVADTVVLASSFGLYRSVDGGATWAPSSAGFEVGGLPLEAWRVHALGGRFYALADYPNPFGGVYRSDDGGRTWARQSEGFVMALRDSGGPGASQPGGIEQVREIASVGDAIFVGTVGGAGLYRSTDGERWEPFDAGLPADPDFGRAVPLVWAEPGAGPGDPLFVLANLFEPQTTFRVDRAVSTAAAPAPARGGTITLGPVHPNPVRVGASAVAVDLALGAAAVLVVAAYDALGRRVVRLEAGQLGVGPHRLALPLPILPAGVYTLVVTAHSGGQTHTVSARYTAVR